jgi:hypothetical protein
MFFVQRQYPDDAILQELVDLDFCLYLKERPRPMQLKELDTSQKTALIELHQADSMEQVRTKVRYLALPIQFDWNAFEEKQKIVAGAYQLLVSYDGVRAGQVHCFHNHGKMNLGHEDTSSTEQRSLVARELTL